MSAPKSVTRFHYQDTIYPPRPQSLAIVLVVSKLNYQVKRDKGGNGKGRKKGECFTFPSFIKNLEKAYTRGSADNTGMRCYSSYFHPTLFEEVIVYDFH